MCAPSTGDCYVKSLVSVDHGPPDYQGGLATEALKAHGYSNEVLKAPEHDVRLVDSSGRTTSHVYPPATTCSTPTARSRWSAPRTPRTTRPRPARSTGPWAGGGTRSWPGSTRRRAP